MNDAESPSQVFAQLREKYELSDEVMARIQAQVQDEGRSLSNVLLDFGIVSHQGLNRSSVNCPQRQEKSMSS